MPSMTYCCFCNTLAELEACTLALTDVESRRAALGSEDEIRAAEALLEECCALLTAAMAAAHSAAAPAQREILDSALCTLSDFETMLGHVKQGLRRACT